MKLLFQILAAVLVLALVVVAIVKFTVLPVKLAVSAKSAEIAELSSANKTLSEQLADAKAAVNTDIDKAERLKLKNYISAHTQVLTDKMIKEAAESLITYSSEYGVPLPLVVGIAQATSNFNTTYLSDDGHRGILALPNKLWNTVEVNINYVNHGANLSCSALKGILKTTSGVRKVLTVYFDDLKYTAKHENGVFKYALMYTCYSK